MALEETTLKVVTFGNFFKTSHFKKVVTLGNFSKLVTLKVVTLGNFSKPVTGN